VHGVPGSLVGAVSDDGEGAHMSTVAVAGLGLLGLVILAVAADQLVAGAARLATMLRMAPVVVGLVIIGLGTSAPEFLVSGVASARGSAGIAMGNLIGSNIINLTLILGAAALVAPVLVRSSVPAREAPLTVAACTVFGGLALFGLGPTAGMALAVLGAAALVLLVRLSRVERGDPLAGDVVQLVASQPRRAWVREALRAALGLAGTLAGAQLVVTNAATLALRWGVPDAVVGFTLVALGTSLPELVTAVQAQRRGQADLLVGNLLGSNLFNSLIGGAVVGLAAGRSAPAGLTYPVVAAMVGVSVLAWLLLFRGYRVSRVEGTVLLGVYVATLPLLG
jgi:cation:H+ antiporter